MLRARDGIAMVVRRKTKLTHEEVLRAAESLIATISPEDLLASWNRITKRVEEQTGHAYSQSRVRRAFQESPWWALWDGALSDKDALLRAVCTQLIEGEALSRTAGATRLLLEQLRDDRTATWPASIHATAQAIFEASWANGDPTSLRANGFRLRLMLMGAVHDPEMSELLRRRVDRDLVEVCRLYEQLFRRFGRTPTIPVIDIIATLSALEDGFLVQAISSSRSLEDRRWPTHFADAAVAYLSAVTHAAR